MLYVPEIKTFTERTPFELFWNNGLLLRSTNWLGDALMTLPASYQMSRAIPRGCGYFVLCPGFLKPLWEACPWVDAVVPMAGKHVTAEEASTVHSLFPGVAVVFPNSFGSALDVWKCRIPQRIGRAGRFRSFLLNRRLPEWPRIKAAGTCHQLSYYLELASAVATVEPGTAYPRLNVNPELAANLGVTGKGWLALAPGAAYGPAKQWLPEYFLAVAKWHTGQGGRVVFVGTGKEAPVTRELASQIPGSLDLAGKTNLSELMSLLSAVDKVVANDSGAMHLAAAVGTSGAAIFGSTDPVATGPIGAPWRIIAAEAECRPCLQRTCRRNSSPYCCLREITPEMVISELEQLP